VGRRRRGDQHRVVGALGRELHREPDPDKETGPGKWTQRSFTETIRTGRTWAAAADPDADLEAIFAYLQSIPAIRNKVPEPLAP